MWSFRVKVEGNGTLDKFKVRLCARGDQHEFGRDFMDIVACTMNMISPRIVISLVACNDLTRVLADVTGAYLNSDLEDAVYMYQPQQFHNDKPEVLQLLRISLYGLRQSWLQLAYVPWGISSGIWLYQMPS